ncbi:hypothetical protein TREMEDRAFT_70194 [Tremella mesenterica DSM 1558]|uniref:uncharacterized protein n=1 Tax=Tremella mesenterica (strain ATCC 24925 / CBS 8224 / DSM 1558 / NBRC 9311 / NRRL Y-6157 / RJB 2259-6 / UBC 559-6) TaxID=578456 RepID=UPI00032CFD6C|nr:uncharacterized protein TREMEDRAFT_70194 [Tremella mesenterica DSM 1558]EIW66268.1 hypothetical protein TREMEDRAFT_70194 [Tremella mesenterica DSM 1558]
MSLLKNEHNESLVLYERPERGPITKTTFQRRSKKLQELSNGEVRVRVDYVSIDPTMRTWLNPGRSYIPPVQVGAVMRAAGIGRVVTSKADGFSEGDLVFGELGWQEYWQGSSKSVKRREIPQGGRDIDHLGLLGVSGLTAYFGMFDIGRLRDGDTVLISAAAGSVGLIATQIALAHLRCKVIAIAGSVEKCDLLKKLGCHEVLNHKDGNFKTRLKQVGLIDVYFDNVGGEILDQVLTQLADHARIILCGSLTTYNSQSPYGLTNTPNLISSKASMTGFITFDYASRYPEARAYLSSLRNIGKLRYDYTVLYPVEGQNGLSRCVEALEQMFRGENLGKTLVKISRDEDHPRNLKSRL